jgi:DsbC/DsbD-like thiol-disulfide interchange protein
VRPGDSVTLSVQITPKRDVRLFALGAKDFTPLALLLTVPRGFSLGKPKYPIPERQSVPGVKKPVPVYDTQVELEQTITIAKNAKPGDTLTINGVVTYQSCDDRVTYRRATLPVTFTVKIQ